MTASGTLLTRVFVGRAQIPVAGATVSVMEKEAGGKLRLLALRVTDANGQIPPITLPTPTVAASQSPGAPAPYSLCDIWVEHPQYGMVTVENVQIFPETNSIQPLLLHPLSETRSDYRTIDLVDITPQAL